MKRRQRGLVLLQAMVLVVILAYLASIIATVTLGRSMVVAKAVTNDRKMFDAQNATTMLNDCMQDAAPSNCNSTRMSACGFPMTLQEANGTQTTYSASASWVNGSCQVAVSISPR